MAWQDRHRRWRVHAAKNRQMTRVAFSVVDGRAGVPAAGSGVNAAAGGGLHEIGDVAGGGVDGDAGEQDREGEGEPGGLWVRVAPRCSAREPAIAAAVKTASRG